MHKSSLVVVVGDALVRIGLTHAGESDENWSSDAPLGNVPAELRGSIPIPEPPMPLDDRSRDEINEAIFAGRKIEAIKIYREATGQGLMESKEFIEQLTAKLREQYPDKVPAQSAGCASVVVLLTVPTGAMLCYLLV